MLSEVRLLSYAKVNLTLDVLGKRPEDGYHYIRSVMAPITLADDVEISQHQGLLVTSEPEIPCEPHQNLAFRAATALREASGVTSGARIHITKRIPIAGGLAGGSSNAAAVLHGLNRLWELELPDAELTRIGGRLGSDIPFCLYRRPALVEGIGELLSPVTVSHPFWCVLAYPSVPKSTGNVFRWLDELGEFPRPDTNRMLFALASGDLAEVAASLGNVFESVMVPRYPAVRQLKEQMLVGGAVGALMSGTGPSVLGLVPDRRTGDRLAQHLKDVKAASTVFVVQLHVPEEG